MWLAYTHGQCVCVLSADKFLVCLCVSKKRKYKHTTTPWTEREELFVCGTSLSYFLCDSSVVVLRFCFTSSPESRLFFLSCFYLFFFYVMVCSSLIHSQNFTFHNFSKNKFPNEIVLWCRLFDGVQDGQKFNSRSTYVDAHLQYFNHSPLYLYGTILTHFYVWFFD